jgi:hypothetical protein
LNCSGGAIVNREHALWVGIKLLGLYLLALSVLTVPGITTELYSIMNHARQRRAIMESAGESKELVERALELADFRMTESVAVLWGSGLRVVVLAALGVYLARFGGAVYRLCRGPCAPSGDEKATTPISGMRTS